MDKMTKKLLQAVAGSGKTQLIIDNLINNKNQIAIITYTEVNQKVLKDRIISAFDGALPSNIHVFGLFQFLYIFCILPYETDRPKGINFNTLTTNAHNQYIYKDKFGCFYKDRLSKYVLDSHNSYIQRIDTFFSQVYIDEVQDFGGDDLNWLWSLKSCDADVIAVGDYFQGTFQTSSRGNTNKKVKSDLANYKNAFEENNYLFDDKTLRKSRRCTQSTCQFVRKNLGIDIFADDSNAIGELPRIIQDEDNFLELWKNKQIKKLFYQEHVKYDCSNSMNWGEAKGITEEDVCVIPTKGIFKMILSNNFGAIASRTKAGFYVACTRAKGNIFFLDPTLANKYKIKSISE